MIPAEPVVSIRDLQKTFFVEGGGDKASFNLASFRFFLRFVRLVFFPDSAYKKIKRAQSIVALTGINLDVMQAETFGIIGDNGAGKTTLLRILAGVLRPSQGSIRVRGRIASLLELGGELSREMTISENITMACALAGMSAREARAEKARILEWADLEQDQDKILGRCSPGDEGRLAFATAMSGDPEVILADEILTVGDGDFRRECEARIDRASHAGGAVLFVSHDLQAIRRSCTRVAWLEGGRIRAVGPPDLVVDEYIRATIPSHAEFPQDGKTQKPPKPQKSSSVSSVESLNLLSARNEPIQTLQNDSESLIECTFQIEATKIAYVLTVELWQHGHFLATLGSPQPFSVLAKTSMKARIRIPARFFVPGFYTVHAMLLSPKSAKVDAFWKIQHGTKFRFQVVEADPPDIPGDHCRILGAPGGYTVGAHELGQEEIELDPEHGRDL